MASRSKKKGVVYSGLVRRSYTVRARSKDVQGKRSTAVAGVNKYRFKLRMR